MIARTALLGLALLTVACEGTAAPERPSGPVIDQADILSPEAEKALDDRLRRYWDQKETAIVVATVPSLKSETVESAAVRLYDSWGIGSPKTQRGVLLLIAHQDRKLRIEIGCGLQTVLPTETLAGIIREEITPHFRASDFDGGASAGVDALMRRIDTANLAPGPISRRCQQMIKEAA